MSDITAQPETSDHHSHGHGIPLWGLFLALTALTAGEVGLFEFWHHTAELATQGLREAPIFPKFVMVILLLVMTLPKAAIVMIYFMHLRFEKPFVVMLAVVPLFMVFVCVLPALTDIITLRNHGQTYNKDPQLPHYVLDHGGHGSHDAAEGEHHEEEAHDDASH